VPSGAHRGLPLPPSYGASTTRRENPSAADRSSMPTCIPPSNLTNRKWVPEGAQSGCQEAPPPGRCPGAPAGCWCAANQVKEAGWLVTHIDPGVVSLVAELRGHERQAAEELEQWKTGAEEHKSPNASRAAITLALLLTDEELDSLEKRHVIL